MTEDNVVRIKKGEPKVSSPPNTDQPEHGDKFSVYAFEDRLKHENGFMTVPRHERQRGKIQEAQRFRKAQGAYLSARLHFFDIATGSQSQLKWWFASTHRIRIHHHLMINYYLEDRPTPVEELIAKNYCSVRNLYSDIKNATDLGSIEVDFSKKDRRQRILYPTRGIIADTDNLFGRSANDKHGLDGMFVFWSQQLDTFLNNEMVDGQQPYSLAQYHKDFEAYNALVGPYLPDTDNQF
tara:strand:+ start:424 stop:1137 length:714 start_codon:yes stop_codon:yes gene_type:complete